MPEGGNITPDHLMKADAFLNGAMSNNAREAFCLMDDDRCMFDACSNFFACQYRYRRINKIYGGITETSRELLLQIRLLAEEMGFEFCTASWNACEVVGEPISKFKLIPPGKFMASAIRS